MRVFSLSSVVVLVSLTGLAFTAGCDSCDKKPDTPAADAGASTGSTSKDAATAAPTASAGNDAGAVATGDAGAKHDMGNCPTSVTGAEVAVKDVEGGIEVTITSKDEVATKEIRERTKKIAEAEKTEADAGTTKQHDHSGAGGGRTGRCTVIMRNTTLATAEIPGGTKITVKPKDKTEVDWLRRETKDRDREAKTASAVGAGAHRMLHCPNAVDGAKTVIKDTKEGVVLTITGPADKVGEIRSRARHTAEVAKKGDADGGAHSGGGTGGGGVGRCPVVVEGETTVEVKDVEGGVDVEVKTKKDVPGLQKETKARAANFSR